MNRMVLPARILCLTLALVSGWSAPAEPKALTPPEQYGQVLIPPAAGRGTLPAVVFDHWLHRALYTCRLCHADIGFAMQAGGTEITADLNRQGFYCGACHDGKMLKDGRKIFPAACSMPAGKDPVCERCLSSGRHVVRERDFQEFKKKMPSAVFGNGIDWEAAQGKGFINPIDFLESISISRQRLRFQKDFSVASNVKWVGDIVFSHEKHAAWNGCEVCHPAIFPVKIGGAGYSMLDISGGEYCGVCHDTVAFSIKDCGRCHSSKKSVQ